MYHTIKAHVQTHKGTYAHIRTHTYARTRDDDDDDAAIVVFSLEIPVDILWHSIREGRRR